MCRWHHEIDAQRSTPPKWKSIAPIAGGNANMPLFSELQISLRGVVGTIAICEISVMLRLPQMEIAMRYGMKPSGATTQSVPYNVQACGKDGELTQRFIWISSSKRS